jgi:hypothetical protein
MAWMKSSQGQEPGRRNVAGCAKRVYGVAEWD